MMTSAQPAFSRRDFLNGGVLIVGFNIAGPLTHRAGLLGGAGHRSAA
jgi:hypothetical protein